MNDVQNGAKVAPRRGARLGVRAVLSQTVFLQTVLSIGLVFVGCAEEQPPPGVDCGAHPSCGVDGPACTEGRECIAIPGCASAICIDSEQACRETCGSAETCVILESFPAQVGCTEGEPVPGNPGDDVPEFKSCEDAEAARDAELAVIQACSSDADCGRELIGTSCGCTRNLVARADADTTRFSAIQEQLGELECGGFVSTCDCPAADGFACVGERCTWNYTGSAGIEL